MKNLILLPLIIVSSLAMIGCAMLPPDEVDEIKGKTETVTQKEIVKTGPIDEEAEAVPQKEECLDMTGLYYYWSSGSMAGMDYNYTVLKDSFGDYIFYADIQSEGRSVDKEISQEEYDAIMQVVKDNYSAEKSTESEGAAIEDTALDADSYGFEAIYADGKTQSINLGQADSEVLSLLKKLLEESPAE